MFVENVKIKKTILFGVWFSTISP